MKKTASLALTLPLCPLLLSGRFSSELTCKTEGGRHIFGKGTGEYSVDTTSGSLWIEKK